MKKIRKIKNISGFALQFIPFIEIQNLDSGQRIKKILDIILENRIIILQGKLEADEEARLIEDTMVMIGRVKGFKGVELAVLQPDQDKLPVANKLRHRLANAIAGNIDALTIIGPASVVREIKKDPRKIEIFVKR